MHEPVHLPPYALILLVQIGSTDLPSDPTGQDHAPGLSILTKHNLVWDPGHLPKWTLTPRGRAHLHQLCHLALPETIEVWVNPETKKEIPI